MVERSDGQKTAWTLQQKKEEEGKERKEIWKEREKRKKVIFPFDFNYCLYYMTVIICE